MRRLTSRWTKVLKMFHVLFFAVWLGGGVALLVLASAVSPDTATEAHLHARALHAIDNYMVIVFAFGLLFTGMIYSLFTRWGFVKHWWVVAKWVVLIFQILFGALVLGPYVTDNVAMARTMTGRLSDYPEYSANLDRVAVLGAIQLALLVFLVFVSVWKPWGPTKRARAAMTGLETETEATPAP